MNKYAGMALLLLTGAGVGFFAGERIGEKIANKNRKEGCDHCTTVIQEPDDRQLMADIARDNGYITEEQQAADEYFAEHEHPSEEDDTPTLEEPVPEDRYISIIDEDEWENDVDTDKVELTYYDEDEIVCDEDENRIEDYEDLIGNWTLDRFVEDQNLEILYVRNSFTETLYMIVRVRNAYSRAVLGIEGEYPIV